MNFTSQYFPGVALRKKPDTTFAYLLPGADTKEVRIIQVGSLWETLGKKSPEEAYSYGFQYQIRRYYLRHPCRHSL